MPLYVQGKSSKSGIKEFHVERRQIDIGKKLKYELELQIQHSENGTVVKSVEYDEIVPILDYCS